MDSSTTEWIRCPVCGGKTRDKMRKDTLYWEQRKCSCFRFMLLAATKCIFDLQS